MDRDAALRPRLWHKPDRSLTESGLEGELIVARTRLLIALLVLFIPLAAVANSGPTAEHIIGLSGTVLLVIIAVVVWAVVGRGWTRPWLPFAASLFDVTMISAISLGMALANRGDMAVNSRITYPAYFLALAATCLRYDVRISVLTGVAAIVQYIGVVLVAASRMPAQSAVSAYYGRIEWGEQFGRLILLAAATALTATVIDRTRRLRLMSTHDALTALYNRPYFDERVAEELLRARRYKRPLTIAVLDLDHFKAVNDRFGHAAGDIVLRRFADQLHESFRRTDIVARYGGEEFSVALPETDLAEATTKVEQLRQLVESTPIRIGSVVVQLTFSAGIVHYPGDGDSPGDLISLGDTLMLSAKRAGRNRVVSSPKPA